MSKLYRYLHDEFVEGDFKSRYSSDYLREVEVDFLDRQRSKREIKFHDQYESLINELVYGKR